MDDDGDRVLPENLHTLELIMWNQELKEGVLTDEMGKNLEHVAKDTALKFIKE